MMQNAVGQYLKINNTICFWFLCFLSAVLVLLNSKFLYTDQLYYFSLSEQFTVEQIQNVLAYQNVSWRQVIGYGFIPIVIIIRVLYTSFCLQIGNLVNETHWNYKSIYNLSLKADIVFWVSSFCNFYYYLISNDFQKIEDLGVNCSSLLKIVGKENIPDWLIFACNSINLFEFFYVVLLVLFIRTSFKIPYFKSVIFVLLTYGIGSYLYITGMTFLYLNFS